MCETSLSVWFVCKLCRGSFGQVDAFIEHKKQKHFTQFQNTTSIVFEESEHGLECPVITSGENKLALESSEPTIKIEVNGEDPTIPFSSEIIDEPNLALAEVKSELITYETEVTQGSNENIFLGVKQPAQNPSMLPKRLNSEETQSVPQQHSTILTCEQKTLPSNLLEPPTLLVDVDGTVSVLIKCEEPAKNLPSSSVQNISMEDDFHFECKLCSKQFESDSQLKIHVGICALYHEDRNRFCVTCNRKFGNNYNLKRHRVTFHGTEEEKLSLYKYKCNLCPKQYQKEIDLGFHLESHKKEKQKKAQKNTSNVKLLKCSHANCGKGFRSNSLLQTHIDGVHLGLRPFSCSFPNCNKAFAQRFNWVRHRRLHTRNRP